MRNVVRIVAVAALATAGIVAAGAPAGAAPPAFRYSVTLAPLNGSGVTGTVDLTLDGNTLVAGFHVVGLEANQTHLRHIHGHEDDHNATCPGLDRDTNGDGLISFAEGLPDYGPVQHNFGNFDTGPDGSVHETVAYQVDPAVFSPLQNRAVVFHGLTVSGTYDVTLPVACAQISSPTPLNQHRQASQAALAKGQQAASQSLLCHLRET
jgi:hypothetical protein